MEAGKHAERVMAGLPFFQNKFRLADGRVVDRTMMAKLVAQKRFKE